MLNDVVVLLGGPESTGRVNSMADLAEVAQKGLPKKSLRSLMDSMHLKPQDMADFLNVTPRNLQRYKDEDLLSSTVSDHVIQLALLFELGRSVMGAEDFIEWLSEPCAALESRRPGEMLKNTTGINTVKNELYRIEHAVFA